MRTFLSIPALLPAVLFGAMSVGCYDLSTTGPHPEDFVREQDPSQTQTQQEQTQAEVASARAPEVRSALRIAGDDEAEDDADDADRKLRVVPDDAP